ncbi:benzoate MFS transporter BenK [Pseudonocardia sp. Ae168_Ps1]|uniref:MFS transporter n=1 Tax=unclassified Pseudonocardia TaxID=2619320 RepID=UPI00094B54A3|nr:MULTISPECIES: MFS transporter [unclassified Pseudonocardia]OLL74671.1 benzoate MFS transporter BenK [Pseudonocardia sp. Ae150A_Ps1]OLL80651.1 benzoate MFS transporter BenK [Pseudonocardia sp. Ae168_Ps1]OLL85220.1 benzoate MFS transporter BenK [Pseudonocardia sp. Ae263_Ps1]OLL94755.1 benzoate MFS transporter BenK [Pseudonocardia sp. Ae356_Ps1]
MAPMPPRRTATTVTLLCWSLVVLDGYDLIVYGTVLPVLVDEPGWGLTPASAGTIGSLAFVGMLVGALTAGALSDRLGRRRTILACTVVFSVCTAACGLATDPATFGTLRLLGGVGLGGLVPAANALAAEFVAPHHRPLVATLLMSGIPIGGSVAALVGLGVLPVAGWRPMFLAALVAMVVVLPVCAMWLPESPSWSRARGDAARFVAPGRRSGPGTDPVAGQPGIGTLFRPPHRGPTLLLALSTTATLFTWYGLGTWLPQLMRTAGVDLGSALGYLLVLNLGAVAGSVVAAAVAVRFGPVRVGIAGCLLAAAGLLVLLTGPGTVPTYLAVVLAGIGTHGTQCLIIAIVARRYPAGIRGSALGVALGIGRVGAVAAPQAGGLLLAAGLGPGSNFLLFALAATVAALALSALHPARPSLPEGAPA